MPRLPVDRYIFPAAILISETFRDRADQGSEPRRARVNGEFLTTPGQAGYYGWVPSSIRKFPDFGTAEAARRAAVSALETSKGPA